MIVKNCCYLETAVTVFLSPPWLVHDFTTAFNERYAKVTVNILQLLDIGLLCRLSCLSLRPSSSTRCQVKNLSSLSSKFLPREYVWINDIKVKFGFCTTILPVHVQTAGQIWGTIVLKIVAILIFNGTVYAGQYEINERYPDNWNFL